MRNAAWPSHVREASAIWSPFVLRAPVSLTQERPTRPRICLGMRRALSPSLVAAAVLADAQGEHRLAFYALFVAIPALAVAAIGAFGDYLEGSSPIFVWVNSLALVLAVAGAALRAPTLAQDRVPTVALSALVLAVCV